MTGEAQGELRTHGERRAVRFERRYEATPAEVWSALTEPQRLARWLADAELDLRLGGRYVLRFAGDDESQVTRGEVLALEPERLLELFWWYPRRERHHRPHRASTRRGRDDPRPRSRPPSGGAGGGYGAGWHAHLDALEAHLGAGGEPDWLGR
jgi:uncharacterized protein YndB with AHSA1/START domain